MAAICRLKKMRRNTDLGQNGPKVKIKWLNDLRRMG
jgi:hypothetical protein